MTYLYFSHLLSAYLLKIKYGLPTGLGVHATTSGTIKILDRDNICTLDHVLSIALQQNSLHLPTNVQDDCLPCLTLALSLLMATI